MKRNPGHIEDIYAIKYIRHMAYIFYGVDKDVSIDMIKKIVLLHLYILFTGCNERQYLPDFTFIKLGCSEIVTEIDSLKYGSAFYIQANFEEDSLYIIINVQPDEIDSIDVRKPVITLKVKILDTIKNAINNFIIYSKQLPNGSLPNAYFEEPALYNGGTFLTYYLDNLGIEHYFCYVLRELSLETQKLHNLLMNYYYQNSSILTYKRSFKINSDSIARTIIQKKSIKGIEPFPVQIKEPIRFIPKTYKKKPMLTRDTHHTAKD
ncbi:MAG: hypothetical protein IPK61_12450 [Saprospiraceae bacterium]|nr:hypothetical protein [Saprospiraceae bacterium]